jgi:predicted XRE-type DNA-binding protein
MEFSAGSLTGLSGERICWIAVVCFMETWKPIPGWEDLYQVSTYGRVKSNDRVSTYKHANVLRTRERKGKVLAPIKMTTGYWGVILCRDGVRKYVKIHKLVTTAFYGPRSVGLITRHLDGNKDNNRLDNLVYGTSQDNVDDREHHGRTARGEHHPSAKLTDAQVLQIRCLRTKNNLTNRELARLFGVSSVRISQLLKGNHRILIAA